MNTHKHWTKHLLTQEHTQACTHINTGYSWMASVQTACHKISCTDRVRAPWPRRYSLSLTVFLVSLSLILSHSCFFFFLVCLGHLALEQMRNRQRKQFFPYTISKLAMKTAVVTVKVKIITTSTFSVHFKRLLNHLFIISTTPEKGLMNLAAAIPD